MAAQGMEGFNPGGKTPGVPTGKKNRQRGLEGKKNQLWHYARYSSVDINIYDNEATLVRLIRQVTCCDSGLSLRLPANALISKGSSGATAAT